MMSQCSCLWAEPTGTAGEELPREGPLKTRSAARVLP